MKSEFFKPYSKADNALQNIFHYILAVGLSVVFALYINGRIGWFVTAILIGAPILSLIMTLFFINRLSCEYDFNQEILCKGNIYKPNIVFKNLFIFPSPPVTVELKDSVRVKCNENSLCIFIPPKSKREIHAEFKAQICGSSYIGINRITVKDYLGIFTFVPKSINSLSEKSSAEISVMPDISFISAENKALRKAVEISAFSDDSEDTAESGISIFGGYPGYEHRAYVPGDPLKRVNWKLSAKRLQMLIRLDDYTSDSSIAVILDSVFNENDFFKNLNNNAEISGKIYDASDRELISAETAEKCVEDSLGIVHTLLQKNYSLTYYIPRRNITEELIISDENDIEILRQKLASYNFAVNINSKRIPSINGEKPASSILCTPYADNSLLTQIKEINDDNYSFVIYSPQKGA